MLCGCSTAPLTHGIPNFSQVDPRVYRGGQPTPEGWAWLKSQGVLYDLKLDTEGEGSDALAKSNGLHVIPLPITLFQQTLGQPPTDEIDCAVSTIELGTEEFSGGGVFVHCQHGQDRTGLMIGIYRVRCDHWTKAQAWAEMMAHGFHPLLRGLCWSWEEDVP